jgi:RecA/RadA recombinase
MAFRVEWSPPGPVAHQFSEATDFVTAIMGPVGSGKTTAALMKIIKVAAAQRPSPVDGVRRCKALVIRDTFVNIKRTILPTWHGWFPEKMGQWVGGPPAQHKLVFDLGTGPIELIVDFMGIGDDTIENLLRSYEMTCFYINEADLLSFDVLSFLMQRAGRYPSKLHGGPTWYGGWLDFNAPEQDHWLHELLIENIIPGGNGQVADGYRLFRQPGGMEKGAENVKNLPPGYYERMLKSMPEWLARRMVHNLWGYSRDGKPVYPEFNDTIHVPEQTLEPVRGIPIGIGADAGGTPAAAIGQRMKDGQWRILAELATGPGTGPTRFSEMLVQTLVERFPGINVANDTYGWCDPSAAYGGDGEDNDPAWLTKVRRATKINFRPTQTNAPSMRQEAVRQPLTRLIDGKPGLLICRSCKQLRKGFNSGYHYRKIAVGGATGRFDTKPAKNIYSHLNEAAEYLLLGEAGGSAGLLGFDRAPGGNGARVMIADSDYDIFGDAA